jgi:hypothetical protein
MASASDLGRDELAARATALTRSRMKKLGIARPRG